MKPGGNILKYRAYYFSLDIISLIQSLPRNYIFEVLGKQLLRSGTSIGANIVEAQGGCTLKDFANCYRIALKSCNESKYWLALLRAKIKDERLVTTLNSLINEADEMKKMLTASIKTTREKIKQNH